MAAATAIALGSAILGTGMNVAGAISQGKQAKNYAKQIQNYQRQKLVNPYNNLQVSTLGADRQQEDLARTMTTYGNLAALSGTRGIASLLPNLTQSQNDQSAKIAANLDEQQKQIDQLKAQGDMQVQGMMEQRQNNDLLGLGQAYQTATTNQQNNWNQVAQGVGTLGYAAASGLFDGVSTPKGSGINSLDNGTRAQLQGTAFSKQPSFITTNNGSVVFNPNPFINYDWLNSQVQNTNPLQFLPKGQ